MILDANCALEKRTNLKSVNRSIVSMFFIKYVLKVTQVEINARNVEFLMLFAGHFNLFFNFDITCQ